MIWCRLSYQWVCLNLGQYQVYEVKPVDQHHYIELTIIPDPAMPPKYKVESYKESRELITAVKGFIDDLMKEHMAAIVETSPVECFIACPTENCNELHINLHDSKFVKTGRVFCTIKKGYCDLSVYLKILSSRNMLFSYVVAQLCCVNRWSYPVHSRNTNTKTTHG